MTDKIQTEQKKKEGGVPLWALALGLGAAAAVTTAAVVYVAATPESHSYFRRAFNYGKRLYNRYWLQQPKTYNPLDTTPQKDPFACDDEDQSSIE